MSTRTVTAEVTLTENVDHDKGVRGMNIPCTVTVKDGQITVEAD